MEDLIQEALEMIVKASIMCCVQINSSKFSRFFSAPVDKKALVEFQAELEKLYKHMKTRFDMCLYDAIDCRSVRPPTTLEREYPTYAGIDGLWFDDYGDPLEMPATKLDSMSNSLRILRFGVLNVKGKCEKRFEKLMFFQGKVAGLPFSISQMTSNLKHMELNGAGSSHDFEISPSDLQRLRNLRVVRLINFEAWRKLPAELGEIIHELRELTLSGCTSIKEIPRSISKLQYLRVLNMEECYGLTGLPEDIGSLSCLQKLNLSECKHIEELPESTSKLRVDWVRELHSKGKLLEAVDPRLLNEYPVEEVGLVLELGLLCSHPHPEARPSMREVVQMLAGDKAHPVPPSEPPSADTPTRTENLDEFIVSFSSYKHGSSIAISHPNRSSDGRLVFTPDRTSPLSLLAATA